MNGIGNNKTVPGVPVCFSSGDRPLFTPLINWSQPTIKSGSLYSRCQKTCTSVHKGVISVLQSELVIPMVSPLTTQSCLQQNERVTASISVIPPGTVATLGLDALKKMPQMSFQLHVREGTGLCPPYGMVRCLAASHLLTCGRHPIIIHSLHFSQLIDVSTGADNPRLIYIWLWKSLNEFFSKLTFLISFCLGS